MEINSTDFRHYLQDITNVYMGAYLTYEQMLSMDDVAFKLKAIISQYLLKEATPETTLAEHLYYMKESDLSYMVYKQLHMKIKVSLKDTTGKTDGYLIKAYEFEDFVKNEALKQNSKDMVIQELTFSKLRMMSLSV